MTRRRVSWSFSFVVVPQAGLFHQHAECRHSTANVSAESSVECPRVVIGRRGWLKACAGFGVWVLDFRVCRTLTPTLTLESCLESRIGVYEYELDHSTRPPHGSGQSTGTVSPSPRASRHPPPATGRLPLRFSHDAAIHSCIPAFLVKNHAPAPCHEGPVLSCLFVVNASAFSGRIKEIHPRIIT